MKQTPEEKQLRINFLPGKLTRDGFLGKDSRHIHDIIAADARRLESLNIEVLQISSAMRRFLEKGKEGLESPVQVNPHFTVEVRWMRGMLPCPFTNCGLHYKLICTVRNENSDREIRFAQLSLHLIETHGFFGGLGSSFRIDPADIIDVLEIKPLGGHDA